MKIIPFKTVLLSGDLTYPILVRERLNHAMWNTEHYKWGYTHPDTFRMPMSSQEILSLVVSPDHPIFMKHRKFGGLPPEYRPRLPFELVLEDTYLLKAEMMLVLADSYAMSYDTLSADEFSGYHVAKILSLTERAAWYLSQTDVLVSPEFWYTSKFAMFDGIDEEAVSDDVHSMIWLPLLDEVKKKMPQSLRNFAEMGVER